MTTMWKHSPSAARSMLSRLGMSNPIVLAPMAGCCTPALVAAVSNAGGAQAQQQQQQPWRKQLVGTLRLLGNWLKNRGIVSQDIAAA
jgi:hypothetical protein